VFQNAGSRNINYKDYFSIVLMAVANANGLLTVIDVGDCTWFCVLCGASSLAFGRHLLPVCFFGEAGVETKRWGATCGSSRFVGVLELLVAVTLWLLAIG
jgi:hypothetical protein